MMVGCVENNILHHITIIARVANCCLNNMLAVYCWSSFKRYGDLLMRIEFNIVHNEKQREVMCVFSPCQSLCYIESILVYLNPNHGKSLCHVRFHYSMFIKCRSMNGNFALPFYSFCAFIMDSRGSFYMYIIDEPYTLFGIFYAWCM